MKRKYLIWTFLSLLLLVIGACNGVAKDESINSEVKNKSSKEKITLKFAVSTPESHTMHTETFLPIMEKITELTEGQVVFEYFPAEQLGKAADLYELTSDGVTDIGVYYASYIPDNMPITSGLLAIPGIYSTAYEGSMTYHALSKQSPVLETDFLNHGVRPLFLLAPPPSEIFTTKKEVKIPEDLKGMTVRVTGDILNIAVEKLEATPVNIALPELYEGLERGVFNSINQNPASINDYGLGELIEYGTEGLSFGGVSAGLVINEKVFQGLPENVQQAIVQVGDEVTESTAKYYDENVKVILQKFKDDGVNIHQLSEEEKTKWQEFYTELEDDWVKEKNNPELEETIEVFKEEIIKYH